MLARKKPRQPAIWIAPTQQGAQPITRVTTSYDGTYHKRVAVFGGTNDEVAELATRLMAEFFTEFDIHRRMPDDRDLSGLKD